MVGGGVLADEQRAADLAVAEAFGDEPEDLHLAEGQPVRERRGGARVAPSAAIRRRSAGMPIRSPSASRLAEQRRGCAAVARRRAREQLRPYS